MSFGSVALGLASLVLGVHHLKKSADHLSGAGVSVRQRQLAGLEAAILRQNKGKRRGSSNATAILSSSAMPGRAFHDSGRHMVGASNGAQVAMQMRSFNIKTLDDRIGYLKKLVDEGKRDPRVYAFARQAVSQKCGKDWCVDEKNNLGEAKLLHNAMRKGVPPKLTARDLATAKTLFKNIRKNVRYTSDIRGVDTYQKPGNTLSLRTADCDDYSTTACSALESLGIPCAFKVIRTKGASDWNHIYALAGFPRANPTKWIPFDASVNMPFGWEAPSKMVAASRIFPLR